MLSDKSCCATLRTMVKAEGGSADVSTGLAPGLGQGLRLGLGIGFGLGIRLGYG